MDNIFRELQLKNWEKRSLESCIKDAKKYLIETEGEVCKLCGATDDLTVDHIIPKSILIAFGIDQKDTLKIPFFLQLLCRRCNVLKKDRINWKDPRSKEILIRLINEI